MSTAIPAPRGGSIFFSPPRQELSARAAHHVIRHRGDLVFARGREAAMPASEMERETNARLFGAIEERLSGLEESLWSSTESHTDFAKANVGENRSVVSKVTPLLRL